jgi:hypothetical protein
MQRGQHRQVGILQLQTRSRITVRLRRCNLATSYTILRAVPDANVTGRACSEDTLLLEANPAHRIVIDNFRLR